MQGLADGYFILPLTVGHYLAGTKLEKLDNSHAAFRDAERDARDRLSRLLDVKGNRTVTDFHRELGAIMWEHCGMARSEEGLKEALRLIPELRERYWREVRVPGSAATLNQSLEVAGRVADFFEFAELMCIDALDRDESCGGHFRVDHQTEDGEAKRDDERFAHASVWEFTGDVSRPKKHREELSFDNVALAQRSYK
jgi:succinate dehydrogenase / fumarate reductase, flavoprotein subunit